MLTGDRRSGATLIELTVSLTLLGAVMAAVVALGAGERRLHTRIDATLAGAEQSQQASGLLPVELRAIAPGEGDIVAGEARDSSLQFRATILSAVVCDTATAIAILAPPAGSGEPPLVSVLDRPAAGDTGWMLAVDDGGERWQPRAITSVGSSAGGCVLDGRLTASAGPRIALGLADGSPPPPPGTVVRVTRPVRYSLYRGGDGAWYLGIRQWSTTSARFAGIQPVAGPYASPAAGAVFGYRDAAGDVVSSGTLDTRRIATIDVTLRPPSIPAGSRAPIGLPARTTVTVAIRNRWLP